jgi:hypothetical protein
MNVTLPTADRKAGRKCGFATSRASPAYSRPHPGVGERGRYGLGSNFRQVRARSGLPGVASILFRIFT